MNAHISISAPDPERAARVIADLWRGEAMVMPPSSGTWIAYAEDDDDSAVEVYPLPARPRGRKSKARPIHLVLASPLTQSQIESIARREQSLTRVSERGPFRCTDFWIEDWLHIEVVAFAMRADLRGDVAPAPASAPRLARARGEAG